MRRSGQLSGRASALLPADPSGQPTSRPLGPPQRGRTRQRSWLDYHATDGPSAWFPAASLTWQMRRASFQSVQLAGRPELLCLQRRRSVCCGTITPHATATRIICPPSPIIACEDRSRIYDCGPATVRSMATNDKFPSERPPRPIEEALRKLAAHPRARPMRPEERLEPGVTLVTFIPGPQSRRRPG